MASNQESPKKRRNPLAHLGLQRISAEDENLHDDDVDVDDEAEDEEEEEGQDSPSKIVLNRRGVPARKRKRNSLIYGSDDMISLPVKSPKKKGVGKEDHVHSRPSSKKKSNANNTSSVVGKITPSTTPEPKTSKVNSSPTKRTPTRRLAVKLPTPTKLAKRREERIADECELTSPEKKAAQSLGSALRNLLKLPKGHKWVCYEFFYSNIDKVLFEGENDFMVCLRESFPQLRTRMLTRVEWCKIRRLLGKPRRCSAAFFAEERAELSRKRHKIRMLQQRKQNEITNYKDLPENIPLQLTIGARVTARLRKPQDGLFIGTVDAYDTSNNTYRISFERTGLGTHSIPDYEVLSTQVVETVPLTTFTTVRARPRPVPQLGSAGGSPSPYLSPMKYASNFSPGLANDPLLSGSTPKGKVMHMDGTIGGYPVKFLEKIVRLSKCLKLKRERVNTLRDLNSAGERKKSFGEYINEDFQRKYASTVIELSQINKDLNEYLRTIKECTQECSFSKFSSEITPTISMPNIIREGCQEDAYDMVNKINTADEREIVENPRILSLISSLTALMLQVKHLAEGERNAFELQALQESMNEIKESISKANVSKFENCIEVHMQHIQSGLSQLGNLTAFMNNYGQLISANTPSKSVVVKNEIKSEPM